MALGTVWGSNTWNSSAWADNTWSEASDIPLIPSGYISPSRSETSMLSVSVETDSEFYQKQRSYEFSNKREFYND